MKKLFILDGMGLIFRAYYALIRSPLRTRKGKNTSAIHGFFKMLIKILLDYQPDEFVIAWDVSRETFRKEIYPEYKANRESPPEELKDQIKNIIELVHLMNIPSFKMEGYEADDVIGTLTEKFKKNREVFIVSGDKDLFQLIDSQVKAIALIRGISEVRILNAEGVKEFKGVFPEQIPDFLAIVGDSSDNIPGVKGIGEKGAVKLLSVYPNLEEIYNHLDQIKGATQKKLIESRENAFLSKKLALIRKDLDLNIDEKQLSLPPFSEIFNPLFLSELRQFELSNLINEMLRLLEIPKKNSSFNTSGSYETVITKKQLEKVLNEIKQKKAFSLDFETNSVEARTADIIGIAVSVEANQGYYIPILHSVTTDWTHPEFVLEQFRPILEDPKIKKYGQNLKYETEVLLKYKIQLEGISFDSMIAAFLIEPGRARYNLDDLAQAYLNYQTVHYQDIVNEKNGESLLDLPIEEVTRYAAEDADIALRLRESLLPEIEKLSLKKVLEEIEMPLIPVLAQMENTGIKIDCELLKTMSQDLEKRLQLLKSEIDQIAGESFNINSPKQLGYILFEKMKLPVLKKTKTGQAATNEEVLSSLAQHYPLPRQVLKYRTYSKLKGTYLDTLPKLADFQHRIHTSFRQTGTQTGRLSSGNPNLQNIPIKDDLGREIRKAFIAEEGNQIVSADYSQVELRLFAHLSEDPVMIDIFRKGLDIHRSTASLILEIPPEEVDENSRRMAKTINYGISYGMSAFRLSRELGISIEKARNFISAYFEKLPGIPNFMKKTLEYAYQNGEVRTLFGRRRPVPELYGKSFRKLSSLNHAERFAINSVVQGTAADIIKIAMIRIQKRLEREFSNASLLLQIHDELLFEVPEEKVTDFKKMIRQEMENVIQLHIPLNVEIGTGNNWSEAH